MNTIDEARNAPKPPVVEKDPRETHVFHVTVSKGHGKPETRKATIRSVHGKDHALKTAIAHYENDGFKVHDHKQVKESVDEAYGRPDAYTRDHHSSVSGMGKHQSHAYHADGGANDEGHGREKFKAKSLMDRPHTVHVDGKPWKKFSNGHQAHAAARTLQAKGKKANAVAHFKEHIEEIDEARMSAAVKLQRAFEREQQKSAASRERGKELLQPKKEEPKKTNESFELEEGIQIHPDRYQRSHGTKPKGGHGLWMFTHKHSGGVDYNDKSQVHSAQGNYSDAKKSAAKWAAEHGHKKVYVMEQLEEGLKPEHNMRPGWMLKADPKLKAKVDANKKKYAEFKKLVGTKPEPVKEETISEGAYEKAEENKKSADAAKKQGDMFAHHLHMADHHDNMAQWHGEKGRHGEADRHAEKSEKHHEEAMKLKEEVAANSVAAGGVAGFKGDAGKKVKLMNEPLKRKSLEDFKTNIRK